MQQQTKRKCMLIHTKKALIDNKKSSQSIHYSHQYSSTNKSQPSDENVSIFY